MKKLLLLFAAATAAMSMNAQDEIKSLCVGEFETPGTEEVKVGAGSWWERAPFQWYTLHCGTQMIYEAEYLQGLKEGDLITEVVFKYGDEGSFTIVEADLHLFIENCEQSQFEQKDGSEDYMWVDFDPSGSQSTLAYEIELYYMVDEEIHFVLDKPLAYTGGNLLLTVYSDRTSTDDAQCQVTYAMRTDKYTTMSMGSDRPNETFLHCYDTGIQFPYHGPNKYVPVLKLMYTSADGIADIEAPATDTNTQFFNLQGVRVAPENLGTGIYVRRTGNTASKIVIK